MIAGNGFTERTHVHRDAGARAGMSKRQARKHEFGKTTGLLQMWVARQDETVDPELAIFVDPRRDGTRSTPAKHALDRHWRNARVHTLHDPVR